MAHPGNKIKLAPVSESVERRELRIAVAVVEDQPSSVARERCQVRGHRVHQRLDVRPSFLINVEGQVGRRSSEEAGAVGQLFTRKQFINREDICCHLVEFDV